MVVQQMTMYLSIAMNSSWWWCGRWKCTCQWQWIVTDGGAADDNAPFNSNGRDGEGGDEDGDNDDAGTGMSEWGPKAYVYKDDNADDEESVTSEKFTQDTWGEVYFTEDDDSSDESADEESDQEFEDFEIESEEETTGGEHDDVKNFRREVIDSIARGLEQGVASDNLVLEINGSKHAW